ncbi:MAG: enoyl-CoA hydratase [Betaproteobacteria bacterium]|nr:enoyl-CoA hydratase [Betaproteobacteria bacterium]
MDIPAPAVNDELLQRSDSGGIATLTLNRPQQFNALSMAMLDAMQAALDTIAADATVRVLVIAANGKVFCPGHDLKEMLANRTRPFVQSLFDRCCNVMMSISRMPQIVIARVHGIATAAGCQLVGACDLAVAAADARFATSGVNFGLFCATPGVAISRNISRKRAMEMLMTGDFIDAPTALQWGLVNRVVPLDRLDDAVSELAAHLLAKPPAVLAAGKKFFYSQLDTDMASAYKLASGVITDNMLGDDALEGVTAFVEKRKPQWRGQ